MREKVFNLSDSVANSSATERAAFIRRTYGHLAVAILGFIGLEYYLVHSPFAAKISIQHDWRNELASCFRSVYGS